MNIYYQWNGVYRNYAKLSLNASVKLNVISRNEWSREEQGTLHWLIEIYSFIYYIAQQHNELKIYWDDKIGGENKKINCIQKNEYKQRNWKRDKDCNIKQ